MDKQNVSYAHNRIFNKKGKKTTDTSCDIDEPQNRRLKQSEISQTRKANYCMIPFVLNDQKKQIYRDKKQISGYQINLIDCKQV